MNRRWLLATATGVFAGAVWLTAYGQSSPAPHQKDAQKTHNAHPPHETRGERVFNQNCSRCHTAPQGFPQQVTGTVLRHMRVRASLSAADEKALLEFMNP
jgi:cytochrome c5